MRCQRCEFENMPGLQKCMRCGSALIESGEPIDVHPPRMSGWKKPIRAIRRGLRKSGPVSAWCGGDLFGGEYPEWMKKFSRVSFFGGILSIVPGLAHIIQKRFYTIRWWVLVWIILLFVSLFLYGSFFGMMLLGLAIGCHVWIAVHSALLAEYDELRYRLAGYFVLLALYFVLYLAVGRLVFYDYQGGYAITNVPADKVQHGDYLLGRRSEVDPNDITRGNFVLARLSSVTNYYSFRLEESMGFVQVVALAGEKIEIIDGQFVVDGIIQKNEAYPVPDWLKNQAISTIVPPDSYFISARYEGTGYNASQIMDVCVVSSSQIEAKAFMRWMPLGRRGFIRESK